MTFISRRRSTRTTGIFRDLELFHNSINFMILIEWLLFIQILKHTNLQFIFWIIWNEKKAYLNQLWNCCYSKPRVLKAAIIKHIIIKFYQKKKHKMRQTEWKLNNLNITDFQNMFLSWCNIETICSLLMKYLKWYRPNM